MNDVRPIDANALTVAVALYMAENAYLNDTALDVLKKVAKWIEEEPTLDYAPMVHGEWIDNVDENGFLRNAWRKCSVCGGLNYSKKPSYCPNCGAKMDGGKNDG